MGRTASGAISGSCTVAQDVPATGNPRLGEIRNGITTLATGGMLIRERGHADRELQPVRVRRAQSRITLKIKRLAALPP